MCSELTNYGHLNPFYANVCKVKATLGYTYRVHIGSSFMNFATPFHGIWLTQSSYWILSCIIGVKFITFLFDCFEFQMAMKCL